MKMIENMSENVKGVILMIAGLALLLHTMGILVELLKYILVAISIYFIFLGFVKVRGVEIAKRMLKKTDKPGM